MVKVDQPRFFEIIFHAFSLLLSTPSAAVRPFHIPQGFLLANRQSSTAAV
jgi:hypothetical protein